MRGGLRRSLARVSPVRRVLFRWRGHPIYSYPFMLYVGLNAGVIVGHMAAHRAQLDAFRVYVATLLLILPALLGARLLYVLSHWSRYRERRERIFNRSEGGAAQYGGFLLVLPLSVPVLGWLDLPVARFWDVGIITILVGMVFTRIGCLLNGCCAGRPSTVWGSLYLPDHLGVWQRRIPTQCLEAAWGAVLLAVAVAAWDHLPAPGALFLLMTGGYGAGRLILESMRDLRGRKFTVHHAISLALVVVSFAGLLLLWPR